MVYIMRTKADILNTEQGTAVFAELLKSSRIPAGGMTGYDMLPKIRSGKVFEIIKELKQEGLVNKKTLWVGDRAKKLISVNFNGLAKYLNRNVIGTLTDAEMTNLGEVLREADLAAIWAGTKFGGLDNKAMITNKTAELNMQKFLPGCLLFLKFGSVVALQYKRENNKVRKQLDNVTPLFSKLSKMDNTLLQKLSEITIIGADELAQAFETLANKIRH